MSTEVHSNGVLSEDFLNTVYRALAFSDINLDLGGADTLSYLDEFFREVQGLEVSKVVIFLLHDQRRGEQECEVELLFDNTEHILNGM